MDELIEAHNDYRLMHSRPKLVADDRLSHAAQGHADWMHRKGKLSHSQGWFGPNLFKRVSETGYSFRSVGENIAVGQTDVKTVMATWLASRPHRNNILGEFTHIGVARSGTYWCVVFGRET